MANRASRDRTVGTAGRSLSDIEEVAAGRVDHDDLRPRIVVGVDGSFGAAQALGWAARQACAQGAVLDVVSVWEELGSTDPDGALHEKPARVAADRLDRALTELLREHTLPERIITAPLQGPPGERLVERARGAELLVLGTTGLSSPEIPGGLGLYCVQHSSVPVVFVPPPVRP